MDWKNMQIHSVKADSTYGLNLAFIWLKFSEESSVQIRGRPMCFSGPMPIPIITDQVDR